jgi:hypothetical protein
MKIVMLSQRDFGGSGLRICQAVRRYCPEHEIVLITAKPARLGSDYCILDEWKKMEQAAGSKIVSIHDIIRNKRQMDVHKKRAITHLQELINEADIVHFKGDEPPVESWNLLDIPADKKTIVSVGGSAFRRTALHPKAALALYPMQDYMRATLRTALTPDLNYPEYRGIYTQQAVDTDLLQPVAGKNPNGRVIAHSPTHYGKKGTDLFLDALNGLNAQMYGIELDMLVHMDWVQCQYRKSLATWFFDQMGVGFYGNAGLEAMAMGVPTVCHISRDAVKQSDGKIDRHHPVFALRTPTVAACQAALCRCMKADWQQASAATREFAVKFHGYKTVVTMWDEIYRGI